ncbi:MAG: sulfite exporter TauE/SafE family protein [Bacteriovoracaceae bacterium]|nr:sulfite exporter TauE/SafE family protein [Bacteriovoracaceae bacterium]
MLFLQYFFVSLFGLLVGTFGTMLGVGGGFIHVPFLMILFNFIPQDAIGTSIGVIFFNTLAGSTIYFFQKRLNMYVATRLALYAIPGATIGPFVVQHYTKSFFCTMLSVLLVLVSYYLFFKQGKVTADTKKESEVHLTGDDKEDAKRYNLRLGQIGTLFIGFLSNLFGIGGGIIHVPFMVMVMKMPLHLVLGTSHLVLCVSSFIGMCVFFYLGNIQVDFMMPIALGSIIGARIGAELSGRIPADVIRKILALTLAFVALRLMLTSML